MKPMQLFRDFENRKMIITADNDTMSTPARIKAFASVWENGDESKRSLHRKKRSFLKRLAWLGVWCVLMSNKLIDKPTSKTQHIFATVSR